MRIVFWGTPDFAVPSLRALGDEGFDIVGVVTQPDRPAGRGRRMRASPVKEVAEEQGLPVLTPKNPKTDEFLGELRALEPDLSVVVAYGHILTQDVLDTPSRGSVNVHASLLPELRGAGPVTWAIVRGHQRTGITVQRMVREMDAGPIIHQVEEPILEDETASELTVRLSELGAEALVEALALLGTGAAEEVEQDHDAATFAPKVDRETARVDWTAPATTVALHIRGMDAIPGAWSLLDGSPLKLFRPMVESSSAQDPPGTVVEADPDLGLLVRCGEGAVRLREVQPSGSRRMSATDWINGRKVEVGQRLE